MYTFNTSQEVPLEFLLPNFSYLFWIPIYSSTNVQISMMLNIDQQLLLCIYGSGKRISHNSTFSRLEVGLFWRALLIVTAIGFSSAGGHNACAVYFFNIVPFGPCAVTLLPWRCFSSYILLAKQLNLHLGSCPKAV